MFKYITIPEDKANHIVYGAFIAAIATFFIHPLYALIAAILIAVGKEVYDKVSKTGNPDAWDALLTVFGALVVLLPQLLK